MKILVVGGGSGGHITPAIAVVRKILEKRPRTKVEFWTDRKYYTNVSKIAVENQLNFRTRKVSAGKFHRYAGWKFVDYFEHMDITLKDLILGNILGFLGFIGGLVQSFWRLAGREGRPDVIFLKGGYVGLPVGMVAKVLKIPYVIHESDVVAGLANRLLMKRAEVVAMGMPFEKTEATPKNWEWVGIPVAKEFRKVSEARTRELKKAFGFCSDETLVVVTGGSQGSRNINEAIRAILPELLKKTAVGLVAGRKLYEEMVDLKQYEKWEKATLKSNFRMWEFNSAMDELLGAADIVVSRAGATTIAELAMLEKAVILVPFARLPGGHQVKNAERLKKNEAVVVVNDEKMQKKPEVLLEEILKLVKSPKRREELARKLGAEAKGDSAARLAEIVIGVGEKGKDGGKG